MSLTVNVKNAKNLPNVEKFSLSDPLAVLLFGNNKKKKTKVIDNNLDPEWNETFTYTLSGPLNPADQLAVEVYDYEKIGKNRLLGRASIPLNAVARSGNVDSSYSLAAKDGSPTTGKIYVAVMYQPPPGATLGGGGGGGTAASQGGDGGGLGDSDPLNEGDEEGGVEGGEEDGDEGVQIDMGAGDAPDGAVGEGPAAGQQTSAKRAAKRKAARKVARANLPNKPIDFQIRFHILEARKLPGANLQPVVKVRCGSTVKGTAVQKSTSNPYWDELIIFSINERPADFLDRVIDIKVLSSRAVLKDSLIGSFKFDVGLVYDEPEHAINHKWLLLTDPDDPTSEAKGYLKVSINVLGPGDVPKRSISKVEADDVDIESNLLRPSGVRLQAASLNVQLYQAEDLPQMDAEFLMSLGKLFNKKEQKELVDPYCVVNFAGHKGKTSHLACTMNPEWNEQINLAIRMPSMCDRLKLTMKDHDKFNRDDFIGTVFVNMTEISAPGDNGFLPTFGPSFVPIYGSPREFSSFGDKYEYLNKGQFDGCAYRGRVMLSLSVNIGNFPTIKKEPIPTSDLDIIPPLLRRRSYKLYAAFLHATGINPYDKPVEFEVSIGNFGNKLDKNVPQSSSTTLASNPVYDGTHYHYLPWFDSKPCVVVNSQWEDNSHRIATLNILLFVSKQLETGLQDCRSILARESCGRDELKERTAQVLGELLVQLEQPLPTLPLDNRTSLDIKMRKVKEEERLALVGEARALRPNLVNPEAVVEGLEDILARLKFIAHEPQISIPDVIIWMLSGNQRVAYKRVPAHQLMFSDQTMQCGDLCGKMQTIFLNPPCVEQEEDVKDGQPVSQLRLVLWLGLEEHAQRWSDSITEAQIAVYAETYENQAWFCGKWGKTGLVRPNYSNAKGKHKLPKEAFLPPSGWDWGEDWFVNPEISAAFEADSGRKIYQEEIFEYHFRVPFTSFDRGRVSWRDVRNAELSENMTKDNYPIHKNWEWISEWDCDTNRAVDEGGWQYAVDAEDGPWGPVERNIHIARRRRWVRTRKRLGDPKKEEKDMVKRQKSISEGWEYARLPHMSYHVTDHKLDMARRRRWHRKLVAKEAGKPPVFYFDSPKKSGLKEKLFSLTKKKDDGSDSDDDSDSGDDDCTQAPRMYMLFPKTAQYKYQFNAYIYQARDIHASDDSGLSDPYAYVALGRYSQKVRTIKENVCPIWDQTLVFEDVFLFGTPDAIAGSPPQVTLEFFDKDTFGKDEYLGITTITPNVILEKDLKGRKLPRLAWFDIKRHNKNAGEVLAAFELMLIQDDTDPPFPPPKAAKGDYFQVPSGIRPILQKTRIEILCWGVRDMRKFQLLPIKSPLVEVECGGYVQRTVAIRDATKNPNFPEPVISMDVNVPKEALYSPPLNIKILDKRPFGRKPLVGVHVIKSLKAFYVDPKKAAKEIEAALLNIEGAQERRATIVGRPGTPTLRPAASPLVPAILEEKPQSAEVAIEMKDVEGAGTDELTAADPDVKRNSEFDWWTKFYLSDGDEQRTQEDYRTAGYDKLMIYDGPLEDYFENFEDIATTLPLYRGKGMRDDSDAPGQSIGKFKGAIKICPFPSDEATVVPQMFASVPPTSPVECIVRLYVIRGMNLQAKDDNGKSDPYLRIKIGKNRISDRDSYVPNTLNPIFGKVYELPAYLPVDHTLKVTVMDYDLISADDIIGETIIDLENRYLSHYRALCGLPETYCNRGMNQWRDIQLPRDILSDFCKCKGLKELWLGTTVVKLGPKSYSLDDFEPSGAPNPDVGAEDQRLALYVLRDQGLVAEHVESRPLFNKVQPGIEQGRLQMWVDIFPKNLGAPPPPVDISSRLPTKYTLRVVIYNTSEVELDETSAITGEDMSDIYVKGWFQGEEETQKTDVHYRSMDGEGNFNWRLVFPFNYIPQEKVMVAKKFEKLFSLDKTERRLPAKLSLQVWDNDLFNPDDFIGTLEMRLDHMPDGQKGKSDCENLEIMPDYNPNAKCIDLFKKKRVKGWWPFYSDQFGRENREITGKVEMELELVTAEEQQERPAGKGREDPNLNPFLSEPNRPATSFLWFTSPWKTFKFIIWKYYKFHIIGSVIGVFAVLILVILIYSLPNYIGQWLMTSLLPGGGGGVGI